MFNSVVEALSEIAPAEHYLRTNVTVPSGHLIGELSVSQHFFTLFICYDGMYCVYVLYTGIFVDISYCAMQGSTVVRLGRLHFLAGCHKSR